MLKTLPSSIAPFFTSFCVQLVHTRYGFYHQYNHAQRNINVSDNPELDVNDMIAADDHRQVNTVLENRRRQEEEQKEAAKLTHRQELAKEQELRAEEKRERQRERKNSEKNRTKNIRMDRDD